MGLNIGINELNAAKLGTTNISSIWLGDDKLWPTAPPAYKFQATYSDSSTYNVECDSNTILTYTIVRPSGYDYSAMTDAVVGNCINRIEASTFARCSNLENIYLPNTITSIGNVAFSLCIKLSGITIPSSVTSIGNESFKFCSGLTSIIIPSSVTNMGYGCFENCTRLEDVSISSNITSIGNNTFRDCKSLSRVVIPSGVTNISSSAFYNCSSLTYVTVEATTPPTLGTNVFNNTNNCPIYVPCESVDAYKSATNWSAYARRIQPISGTCLDCNWNQYQAEDAEPHNPTYAARFRYDVDVSNGYFIDFTDGALGYLSIVRDTNSQTWKVVTSSGETPITFVNDVGTVKFKDFGFESMEIDSMSLFNGIPFDIELCEKSLKWVTFNNGDTIPNDLDIYGFSGTAENLTYTFGYGSALGFTQTRNNVDYNVMCNDGATCWSDYGIPQSSIIEEIISDHNCSCDCVNQGATVSGTINLYIYN